MQRIRRCSAVLVVASIVCAGRAYAGINTWTSAGPEGGPMLAVRVVRDAPNVVWSTGQWSGVFRSTDGGVTWASTAANFIPAWVLDLAVDPARPEIAWASNPGALRRTGDAGATWTSELFAQAFVTGIAPSQPDTVYAAESQSSGVLHRTTDGGATWTSLAAVPPFVRSVVVDPTTPSTLYVASANGQGLLSKSTDGGATFAPANAGLETTQVNDLAVSPLDPDVLVATTLSHGIYRSTDAGASWQPATASNGYEVDFDLAGNAWTASSNGRVLRSIDGGATWTQVADLATPTRGIAAHPTSGTTAWLAILDGIARTTDTGASWTTYVDGLTATVAADVAVDPTSPNVLYAATWGVGVHKSSDGGASWTRLVPGPAWSPLGETAAVVVDPLVAGTVWASSNGVHKSTDGGTSWSQKLSETARQLVVDPTSSGTLYAVTGALRKTTDGGGTWTTATSGLTGAVRSLAMDPSDPQVLYAGTSGAGVFKSTNGAASWAPANSGLPANGDVLALAVDPAAPQTVYASLNVGSVVRRSTDGGAT
jgi:photosystem II stability/assembly factor-like uncharacterized protein